MSPNTFRKAALLVLAFALILDLGYFVLDQNFISPDSSSYLETAQNMVTGNGFTNHDGQPETRRTPVYPVLIALFMDGSFGIGHVVLFQHLLHALMAVLVLSLALEATQNRFIAITSAIIFAVDLPSIFLANRIMTETLFTAALMAVFYLSFRLSRRDEFSWHLATLTGILGGLTVLIRPISILFFVPLALYFWLNHRSRAWGIIALFVACYLVFPVAWMARNRAEVGIATISSISADNMLRYRAAGALASAEPGDFLENFHAQQDRLAAMAAERLRTLYGPDAENLPHARKALVYNQMGKEIILANLRPYLRLTLRGIATSMLGGGATGLAELTGLNPAASRYLVLAYTLPCLFLSILGLWYLGTHHLPTFYLVFFSMAYFIGISAGGEAYSRFRIPVEPLYAIAIAAGLYFVLERITLWRTGSSNEKAKSVAQGAPF